MERDAESALIGELLDRLPDVGGALIVRGEAGIRKSALLQRARAAGEDTRWPSPRHDGVESQAELAFAGLPKLLHATIGLVAHLSEAQRWPPCNSSVTPRTRARWC